MEKKLIELDSIAEFNKNLALLSIQVDALQDSYSSEKLNHVNRVLSQFVQVHSEDQDYGDINFLIGLLKMLHCFPDELPKFVTDKISDIQKSIGCADTTRTKTAKETIYDYVNGISEESLGEFHI